MSSEINLSAEQVPPHTRIVPGLLEKLDTLEATQKSVASASSEPVATKFPGHLLVASGAVVDFRMPGVTRFKN